MKVIILMMKRYKQYKSYPNYSRLGKGNAIPFPYNTELCDIYVYIYMIYMNSYRGWKKSADISAYISPDKSPDKSIDKSADITADISAEVIAQNVSWYISWFFYFTFFIINSLLHQNLFLDYIILVYSVSKFSNSILKYELIHVKLGTKTTKHPTYYLMCAASPQRAMCVIDELTILGYIYALDSHAQLV